MRHRAFLAGVVVAFLPMAAEAAGYREFGKWSVGCDNSLACSAFGISDKDGGGERWGLRIDRAPGFAGKIALRFNGKDISDKDRILIDGKMATSETPASQGGASLPQAPLLGLVNRLLNAATMTLPGEEKDGEIISLTGLKAALLYMDEQQGRIGARNAFVSKGEKKSATPPRAYPIIKAVKVSKSSAAGVTIAPKIGNAVMAHYRATTNRDVCDLDLEPTSQEKPTAYPLGKGLLLMEVYCWRAAYQAGSVFYLYDSARGTLRDAPFETLDLKTGAMKIGRNESVSGAGADEGGISGFHKDRGGGGCGESLGWQWDGKVFRLTSQSLKSLCDHADAAFRLYRAQIRGADGKLTPLTEDADEDMTF